MQDPKLWAEIEAFEFDRPDVPKPFSQNLGDAEDWTKAHTAKVIGEYRKFIYLSQISKDQVVPSADVDKAWHLHLTYTRDYWDRLCGAILKAPLHHVPSEDPSEHRRYLDGYERTLALYEREFGKAPSAVWLPVARIRAKPRYMLQAKLGGIALALGLFGALLGVPFAAILAVAGLLFAIYALFMAGELTNKHKSSGGESSGCSSCGD